MSDFEEEKTITSTNSKIYVNNHFEDINTKKAMSSVPCLRPPNFFLREYPSRPTPILHPCPPGRGEKRPYLGGYLFNNVDLIVLFLFDSNFFLLGDIPQY